MSTIELALASVPGNGYVVGLLLDVVREVSRKVGVRVSVTYDAPWPSWLEDRAEALPDVIVTASPGLLFPLAPRLRDLGRLKNAITAAGDQIPWQQWVSPGAAGSQRFLGLPLLYDPLLLLLARDFPATVGRQGFPFLQHGWSARGRVAPWTWDAFIYAVSAYMNEHPGIRAGIDLGVPDTGPALCMWLAAGWGDKLARPAAAGTSSIATFADQVSATRLKPWQTATGSHTPPSGMDALLTLADMGGTPSGVRFTHTSTAAGHGTAVGAPLTADRGWRLAPLPTLRAGAVAPGRYLIGSVAQRCCATLLNCTWPVAGGACRRGPSGLWSGQGVLTVVGLGCWACWSEPWWSRRSRTGPWESRRAG